jgi:N utilization substance protein A
LHPERGEATVIVNEDQLSKAIGKEGKNVRLAAKLTEWKIDLVSSREYHIRQRITDEMSMDLDEMTGVTTRIAGLLQEAGVTTIAGLAAVSLEDLLAIPGIGPKTAESLSATANVTLEELDRMIEQTVSEELAKVEAEEKPLFDESIFEAEPVEADEIPTEAEEVEEEVVLVGNPFEAFDEKVKPASEEAKVDQDQDQDQEKLDPFANSELDD